ncbi:CGNR zinc finger domain-containing protein [Streptomyces sp. TRM72054]|uniref:CGNR zinc finger domain-containing protein n=1 Tax=Streptomyces sp. TRM72054 TaxID=2870562 RepID=UPI001C8C4270|nr:CGNR zinc finger domain-containing protein [Streptomyces sp. TRM72054]MBX9399436.1 CGNR zinc finger domain-containing protein [Streptomyces sp. TRM72054]
MNQSGFQPAQRLIDIASAVRTTPDLARTALAELLARHGEGPDDLTEAAFSDGGAQELRDAAARMSGILSEADVDRAALALNSLLAEHAAAPRLSRHDGHAWHLHIDHGDDAGWGNWFIASSALALAQILSEYGRVTWGACKASNCRNFYLGTGPGSPRRYCSTTCASRARVAAHRRRKQEAPLANEHL